MHTPLPHTDLFWSASFRHPPWPQVFSKVHFLLFVFFKNTTLTKMQKCNIHVNCHLIRVDMGGMGSRPPCLWSSLSWLSGSLTTFRWLSKQLPVGFVGSQFEAENLHFLKYGKIRPCFCIFRKYKKTKKIRKPSCIFPQYQKIRFFWYFQSYKKYNIQKTTRIRKNKKYIKIRKQYQKTKKKLRKTYDPRKNTKNIRKKVRPIKQYKKYDPPKIAKRRKLPKQVAKPNFVIFRFANVSTRVLADFAARN